MILISFGFIIFTIIVCLYFYKIKELKHSIVFKNILTDTQARVAKLLEEEPIEILGKNSIVDKLKNKKESVQINFVGGDNHETLIKQMAVNFLNRGSIMRKIGSIAGEIKKAVSECPIENNRYSLYENGTVGVYQKKAGAKTLKAHIPLKNLTFSMPITALESIADLESYGKAVGQIFAIYENSIFIKMLEGSGKVHKCYATDEASIISACLRLKLNGDYIFILPSSFKDTLNIFYEEIKSNPEMRISYQFVNDLSLTKLGIKALAVKKESYFKIVAAQEGSIDSAILELNNQVYIQSFINTGYCSSGIEESIIFKNNNLEENLI